MAAVMTDRYPSAVLASTLIHGAVIGLLLLLTYVVHRHVTVNPQIFELVQGAGDNYGATVAPKLGSPVGVKLIEPEPAPVEPAPAPIESVAPPKAPVADPASKITKAVQTIERKDRQNTAKIRAEEQRKAKEEAARATLTKQQFDKLNKSRPAPTTKADPPARIPKVDGEGIAQGVLNGSTANKIGGAGGPALTRDAGDLMDAYFAMFKQRLLKTLEPPPGLSDTLEANVTVTITSSGNVTAPKITTSSGSAEFDRAVLAALARVLMPARPDPLRPPVRFVVRLRDVSAN